MRSARTKTLLTMILILGCDGCATAPNPTTSNQAFNRCQINRDDYKKFASIASAPYPIPDHRFCTYELVATRELSGGPINYAMRINAMLYSWGFFQSATDSDGRDLVLRTADAFVDGKWTHEQIIVLLDRSYIDEHAEKGLNLRIDGRISMVIIAPPQILSGFLARVHQEFLER